VDSIAAGFGIDRDRLLVEPEMGALPGKMTGKRMSLSSKAAAYAALFVVCALAIIPFLWMVSTSLKPDAEVVKYPPNWLPSHVDLTHHLIPTNYADTISSDHTNFRLWTRNTLIIVILSVTGTVISSSLVAYGFARIRFRGRGFWFGLMLSTMMIPFPVVMAPLFVIFVWLGNHTPIQFLGTFKPLWVPQWFGSAFNIFLLRQFFVTIPEELSEAARIDGCNEFGIFWRIMLPLSRPALAVVAIFTFMWAWRDFLGPLIYLQYPSQYTLSLGLQTFQSQNAATPWNQLMAASVLVILPVVALFFMAQRTFIEGIATTGMKG
jgi:multiple sugar transport system permease protein